MNGTHSFCHAKDGDMCPITWARRDDSTPIACGYVLTERYDTKIELMLPTTELSAEWCRRNIVVLPHGMYTNHYCYEILQTVY